MSIDWQRMMPDAWRVFFRFRMPRQVQAAAMPHVVRGSSTLISSPTASGKTEAAFAPLYQRHISFRRSVLSVVYVAPTKALVNDMHGRLTEYFNNSSPDVIQRYTGDHHDYSDAHGKFALLCTPEALDSLQLVHPELLGGARAVICDELHLLHGTARGQQLRSVISRLRHNAQVPADLRDVFQVVGMTATVQDQAAVAELWLGKNAEVVDIGEPRPIQMQYLRSEPDAIAPTIAAQLRERAADKVLLFANTRNQAHELAIALNQRLTPSGWPVYLHVGILARSERERIEYAMKHERRGICVATSTLEVGIDIGDIDVVVLCQPPKSVSSFLQRLGRGNRRSGVCVVWSVITSTSDERSYAALLHCGSHGILDDVHEYHRYSVDVQQLLSLAWIGVRNHDPLTLSNSSERSGFSISEETVLDMIGTGMLKDVGGALVPSDAWMDVADKRKIHSVIVGAGGIPIFDTHSGETIGVAGEQMTGGLFYAGTRMRSATGQDSSGVYVEALSRHSRQHRLAKLPVSYGGRRGRSRQLVWAMAEGEGVNPRRWVRNGSALSTFGGDDYNLLLITLLAQQGIAGQFTYNSVAITGVFDEIEVTPKAVLEWTTNLVEPNRGRIPANIARKFREGNAFTRSLSPALQRKEAAASIPLPGFVRWLQECCN